MKELYVVNCCRTAVGSFGGSLKNTPAAQLGSIVVKEALKRANVAPENVDELMFGCILTAGLGQNVARQVGVGAGLPYSVPAYTVGMVCGSGMKSVIEAGRAILAGDADIVVCGGTENMSAAPFASFDERWGARMGDKKLVDTMIKDGLWDAFNNYHMGTTAENICDVWGITREELDAFGAASQQKTEAAQAAGRFDDEIVPVPVKVKKEIVEFKKDEFPRAGSTVEGLAKLRGAFPVGPEGVEDEIVHTFEPTGIHEADTKKHVQRVTAGNASGINDGAAAIVLASGEAVKKYNLKPMAKLVSWGQGGVDPKIMGVGPVPASRQAMQKAEKKALAEELVEKLNSYTGDDIASYFAELADEYSEDPGRETYPTGYTFTTGSMVQEFEDAAYALSEGEVSEVVESSFGYHILLRLPLDKAAAADEVRDDYFTNFIAEQMDSAVIATSEDYDKLDPQTIYEAIVAAQAEG